MNQALKAVPQPQEIPSDYDRLKADIEKIGLGDIDHWAGHLAERLIRLGWTKEEA